MAVYFDPDGAVVEPRTTCATHGLMGQGQGQEHYNAPAFRPQQQQQVTLIRTSPRDELPQVQSPQQFMTGADAFGVQQERRPTATSVLDMRRLGYEAELNRCHRRILDGGSILPMINEAVAYRATQLDISSGASSSWRRVSLPRFARTPPGCPSWQQVISAVIETSLSRFIDLNSIGFGDCTTEVLTEMVESDIEVRRAIRGLMGLVSKEELDGHPDCMQNGVIRAFLAAGPAVNWLHELIVTAQRLHELRPEGIPPPHAQEFMKQAILRERQQQPQQQQKERQMERQHPPQAYQHNPYQQPHQSGRGAPRERFYECASAIQPAIRLHAPALASGAPDGGSTKIGGSAPMKQRSFLRHGQEVTVELAGSCEVRASPESGDKVPIWCGTFNLGGADPPDLTPWMPRGTHAIYVVCAQDCGEQRHPGRWLKHVAAHLGKEYAPLAHREQRDMAIAVMVRRSHLLKITNCEGSRVPTTDAACGTRGGVAVSFVYQNTSMCFISAHLASAPEADELRETNLSEICSRTMLGSQELDVLTQFHHVFLIGDLGYRIELAPDEIYQLAEAAKYRDLLMSDGLVLQQIDDGVLHGFSDPAVDYLHERRQPPRARLALVVAAQLPG
eukprot:TRINITY_DN4568_c0_g1_i3.p1 TRINITY_DN4568_c0_g1~~TRINITY_DN4568_c0_g1_i3.p1  ORF type:complete len:617 (+),score=164.47 TRINITY_DN4568_c0_g1_i3:88-1938(+)